jgi:general secretion pathway protein G
MISTYLRLKRQREAGEIEGGFTLIELLIVIVVLGILAAVVIFALGGVTSKSAQAACSADAATIQTAVAAYNANNGANPANLTALTATANGGPYLSAVPSNGTHYAFGYISNVLYIEAPGTPTWQATPTAGTTLATGIAYAGPNSTTAGCAAAAVQ